MWGYVNEADPYVMEMQIAAAADHGVNVFIYDWYWYDRRPFLKNCLEEGFGFLLCPGRKQLQKYKDRRCVEGRGSSCDLPGRKYIPSGL